MTHAEKVQFLHDWKAKNPRKRWKAFSDKLKISQTMVSLALDSTKLDEICGSMIDLIQRDEI